MYDAHHTRTSSEKNACNSLFPAEFNLEVKKRENSTHNLVPADRNFVIPQTSFVHASHIRIRFILHQEPQHRTQMQMFLVYFKINAVNAFPSFLPYLPRIYTYQIYFCYIVDMPI